MRGERPRSGGHRRAKPPGIARSAIRGPMKIRFAICALVVVLGGCAAEYAPTGQPSFYADLAQPGATLDAAAAASMISGYRANNGLPEVALDPQLMQLAQAQAANMAKRDKLDHNAG